MQISSEFLDLLDVDRYTNITCNCFAKWVVLTFENFIYKWYILFGKRTFALHHYCPI